MILQVLWTFRSVEHNPKDDLAKMLKQINDQKTTKKLLNKSVMYRVKPLTKNNMIFFCHLNSQIQLQSWLLIKEWNRNLSQVRRLKRRSPLTLPQSGRSGDIPRSDASRKCSDILKFFHTVDGRNSFNQLRLVVHPFIYIVLYILGGAGFFPSTVRWGSVFFFLGAQNHGLWKKNLNEKCVQLT